MPGADRPELADARVQELAGAILERPEYRNFRLEGYDPLAMLAEKWRAAMNWLLQLHESDARAYWLLVAGLGAICLALLAHVVWTLHAALRSAPPAPPIETSAQEQNFAGEGRDLARRGQHLEAAHRLLLASLRRLAQRRLIPLRPEDGNHAVCQQLAASGLPAGLREQLVALILDTERAWFGADLGAAQQAAPALYQRWDAAYAQLSALGGAAQPGAAGRGAAP